jgi:membrane-bound lytic murein transglycosylase MltF
MNPHFLSEYYSASARKQDRNRARRERPSTFMLWWESMNVNRNLQARTIATWLGLILAASAVTLAGCGGANSPKKPEPQPQASAEPSPPADAAPVDSLAERMQRERWTGDLNGIVQRRYLRVLVIPDKMYFFFDGQHMRGVTYDNLREFEVFFNKRMKTAKTPVNFVFIPVSRDEILKALAEGRGDIAASGLGITPERQAVVDFSDPVRDKVTAIPVTGPDTPPLKSLEELSGKEVYVPLSTVFPAIIGRLNERFKQEGKPPVVVRPADENLEQSDILEMVNAGLVGMTLADSMVAEFWARIFDRLRLHPDAAVVEGGAMGWAFRKDSPGLKALANEFIKDHRVGTAFGNTVLNNYLRGTKWARDATSGTEINKFQAMATLFRKYGDQYDLPYLLVVAQAYQESRLDNSVRSPAGAVGVMQIKPSTAAGQPIGITQVEKLPNNINAGTKYLRFLLNEYFKDEPMDRVNRSLFAIASYNAGPNKIQQLRREAKAEGLDPNRWFNSVELVAAKRIGRETVQYVSNIYKYYLAYKMVTEKTDQRAAATRAAKTVKK